MSSGLRRARSTTAVSTPPESSKASPEIQLLLDNVSTSLCISPENPYPDLAALIDQFQSLLRYLASSPEPVRASDDFRRLQGFQILLNALRAFSGFYDPTKRGQKDKTLLFALLECVLGILAQTFRGHYGNQRYFERRVDGGGGGWPALEQAIASIGSGRSESDLWSEAQLFGRLLSFAFDDQRLENLCQKVIELSPSGEAHKPTPEDASTILGNDRSVVDYLDNRLSELLEPNALLHNSQIVPTIIDFWAAIPRQPGAAVNPVALVVIRALQKLGSVSKHNLVALHETGILSKLLPLAFDADTPLGATERQAVESLCGSLISLGVNTLSDAQYLVCSKSHRAADFLLESMRQSHGPSFIQFDLSLHGFASIELPTLGRAFPPPSSAGYTFTAWICIDQFDSQSFTTIFGAFDISQTCFLLAYFDEAHNFILQTSVVGSRPSVRFKSTVFKKGRWYHIAIVHRRARTLAASKASLYVNGEFAEEVKCQYPAPPPTNSSTESFTSFSSSPNRPNPVQGFLGTPRDLSSKLGPGVVFSRWSLASFHLFEDTLSDDLIAVYYRLGPRYNGNFQDCLGSFQTYEASAALGMRNDMIHPGKDDHSEILNAIRDKASHLVPETRIILSILPSATLGDDDRHKSHESQLLRGLTPAASSNLYQLTHHNGISVAINGAVPSINEALVRAQGTAVLTGDPVVIIPQSLDDAMWRLGGFAGIVLKMVEKASTKDEIVRAVETLFESIKGSWRNSEAMERENGYAILGALIRGKVGAGVVVSSKYHPEPSSMNSDERDKLGFQLLSLVLGFVGYNHEKPEESFIINPLAYRILLVDYDMWRKSAPITQKLYYKQFVVFGVNSKFHQFNSRRLFRMRESFGLPLVRTN